MNQSTVTDMALTVQKTPLRIQYRRLLGPGVQTGDGQHDLNIGRETGRRRRHDDALAVELPGQLTQEQLIYIRRQVARPAPIGRSGQGPVRLALQQGFALQIVGHRNRTQQNCQTTTLFRLTRLTTIELIKRGRLAHTATSQTQNASHQQDQGKA